MRLPLTPQLSTKDGVSNKNARLTNTLKETTSKGDIAVLRPGLTVVVGSSGVGKGLASIDGDIVSIFGTAVTEGDSLDSIGSVTGDFFDFAQGTQ